jgi:putative hydrolase of the HAD superfamily
MDHIRHWLFDLDDTLYPASCGLFKQVSGRITECISATLGISLEEARLLQREYWRRYGTSLRGLILHHRIDPEPFIAYVHDVPVERWIRPDPSLRALLVRLPGGRHVFTNSPGEYARRVLAALEVDDLFENVFDIRHSEFHSKPHPHAYATVLRALGGEGKACLFVDDAPQNLVPARACGMTTVWLRQPLSVAGGRAGGSVEIGARVEQPHLVIDAVHELEDAVRRHFERSTTFSSRSNSPEV